VFEKKERDLERPNRRHKKKKKKPREGRGTKGLFSVRNSSFTQKKLRYVAPERARLGGGGETGPILMRRERLS